ncbi:uncharacterized protein LOC129756666 isoform X2 [Uranotaenia lowii]|uniref:uncharacterized protein LOC129756666 isoform X2 n=1 Tax=Uranotaenia lowii TaxID=190385 RepID=UPI0024789E26|nr:uncharacterized protein LOC129756666 isoform X2 [Uranotaenia lowii]
MLSADKSTESEYKPVSEILIQGKLKSDAKWFCINFCLPPCGEFPKGVELPPAVYHLGVVFHTGDTGSIVHRWQRFVWQPEEAGETRWPYRREEDFLLVFHFEEDSFKFCAEGTDQVYGCQLDLHVPLETVQDVELLGDLEYAETIFKYK